MTIALSAPLAAQETEKSWPPDVTSAVNEGAAERLETRFSGGRTPDEICLIARAYANKARRARTTLDRERALEHTDAKYTQWLKALEKQMDRGGGATDAVALASARVEYAGALMGLHAAGELDQFEITAGQRGDRKKLITTLEAAHAQYVEATKIVTELYEGRAEREDEYLAAGIYDTIIQLCLDIAFNQAWAEYYIGLVEPEDQRKRGEALRAAEQGFQELVDTGRTGQMLFQCHLGLAMAQREQGRYEDARRNFARALSEGVDEVVEAQARCELARCHIADHRFAEARTVLAPLLAGNADDVPDAQRATRFYMNLAQLLDANSHLIEADAIRAEAQNSTAKKAILRQAERARETGLARLNRLAAKGGPWPAVVQLYITASVSLRTRPEDLSSTELLFTARQLMDAQRYAEARERLKIALARPEFQKPPAERDAGDSTLGGQLLMELGKCEYRLDDLREAAQAFDDLARNYRSHELAEQAATFAYQLRVELARKSKQREDYGLLADTLLNLLQSYPDHPERDEAAWLLPVTLQAAGRYVEAADEFGKVGKSSPHWDEAQLRRLLCQRFALENTRGSKPDDEFRAEAERVAAALSAYADETSARAAELTPTEAVDLVKWSAEARVNAAELLAAQGVERYEAAVTAVTGFESRYPDSELVGRVLAVRIRAHRGLRQFEQATQILEQYLQTVPPERAGAVLSSLARGMQEEVERLQADGRNAAARRLAGESVETFVQLERWLQQDEKRAAQVAVVSFGRAQMLHVAGELESAKTTVTDLLKADPQNGNYRRLLARILTAQLSADASAEQVASAKDAWAELLKDPTIRKRAPERFWEARYNWLALLLREGAAADVDKAIEQEQVWYPDLGGPPWHDQLLALRQQARTKLGLVAEDETSAETGVVPSTAPGP